MNRKISLALCTASLFLAYPLTAQSSNGLSHGRGHGHGHHGNNSNHSGHDDDGNSAGHRKDAPHGFGDPNLVLTGNANVGAVAAAVASATSSLRSGSMTTLTGAVIPSPAQTRTYDLLTASVPSSSATEISTALSTAGPAASPFVPDLVRGLSELKSDPARLPAVIAQFNGFTNAASSAFIASPPPEYIAMHSVLARLVAAAGSAR
jgi:hypothetical protein